MKEKEECFNNKEINPMKGHNHKNIMNALFHRIYRFLPVVKTLAVEITICLPGCSCITGHVSPFGIN